MQTQNPSATNPGQDPEQRLETAKLYHRAGKLQQAEDIYRSVLSQEPQNAEATHLLGLIALQSGKPEMALELFKTAIQLDNSNPVCHANQGTAYFMLGRPQEAEASFRRALELEDYPDAHANLGKILQDQNRLQEALEHLRQAVNLGQRDSNTLATLAQVHYSLGNLQKAEDLSRRALRETQVENQAYRILVQSLLDQGWAGEAVSWAQELLRLEPEQPEHQALLARAQKQAGQQKHDLSGLDIIQ